MVSGAYAAEYGQREDIDEAMKKVQVRSRREANNGYRNVRQLHTKRRAHGDFIFIAEEKLHHCAFLLHT